MVDTSAWVALAWQEADAATFRDIIESSLCITSPAILLETHIVMRNRGAIDPLLFIERILAMRTLDVMPLGFEHFAAARDAFDRYGKGRGHPAQLNFGDCMSYALAKVAGVPLLFKGDDFRHTDIEPALSA